MKDLAKLMGFDDVDEMNRLISNVDISTPSRLAAFKVWQNQDGTKAGLLRVMTRDERLSGVARRLGLEELHEEIRRGALQIRRRLDEIDSCPPRTQTRTQNTERGSDD